MENIISSENISATDKLLLISLYMMKSGNQVQLHNYCKVKKPQISIRMKAMADAGLVKMEGGRGRGGVHYTLATPTN